MGYERKILYGFSDIKINGTPILGGKSVTVNLEVQSVTASNKQQSFKWSSVVGATGQLTVLGLTAEEMNLIFGYQYSRNNESVELIVNDSLQNNEVELSFARKKANGKEIRYYMKVVFDPTFSIDANTLENGNIEESTLTLDFEVIKDGGVYYRQIENI